MNTGADPAGPGPAICAHRGGSEQAAPGTYDAYRAALELGADFAEFDVRQTRDQVLVGFHPARAGRARAGQARAGWARAGWARTDLARGARPVAALTYRELCRAAGYEVPLVSELASLLAGRAGAHVDLKESGCAARAVAQVLTALDPARVIVTTRDPAVARRLSPAVPVGLTIGGDAAQTALFAARLVARPWLSRLDDVTAASASWAAVHHRTATPALLRRARGRGLKVMIWTVNGDAALRRWLSGRGADMVVTDQPARAIALRGR